jgi:hypothetical protein
MKDFLTQAPRPHDVAKLRNGVLLGLIGRFSRARLKERDHLVDMTIARTLQPAQLFEALREPLEARQLFFMFVQLALDI